MSEEKQKFELYIYGKERIDICYIPTHTTGKFWLEKKKEPFLEVQVHKASYYLLGNERYKIEEREPCKIQGGTIFHIVGEEEVFLLLIQDYQAGMHQYTPYKIEDIKSITIGRNTSCNICLPYVFVSNIHALLKRKEETYELIDEHSKNGVYVNSKRKKQCVLQPGDVIHIMGFQMIMGNDCISIPATKQQFLSASSFTAYNVNKSMKVQWQSYTYVTFLHKEIAAWTLNPIGITPPTERNNAEKTPFIYILGPSLTMGLSSLCIGFLTIFQSFQQSMKYTQILPTVVMSFSMALGTILWPILLHRYETKKEKQKKVKYTKEYQMYLQMKKQEIQLELKRYKQYLVSSYQTWMNIQQAFKNKEDSVSYYRQEDENWLSVALGYEDGVVQLTFDYEEDDVRKLRDDVLYHAMLEVVHQKYHQTQLFILPLMRIRALGIHGKESHDVLHYLCIVLLNQHSYKDLKLLMMIEDGESRERHLRWLPHMFDTDVTERYLFCSRKDGEAIATVFDKYEQQTILIVNFGVLWIQSLAIATYIETYPNLMYIQAESDVRNLHPICQNTIEINEQYGVWKEKGNTQTFTLQLPSYDELIEITSYMSKRREKVRNPFSLQDASILDLYQCGNVEQLNVEERWKKNKTYESLEAIIGWNEFGDRMALDIHEGFHGPHGLLAGMTGSGKSEFLLTYLLSMAITYSCEDVSFLLIDYKGGLMAKALEKLPHVTHIMTNLSQQQLYRMVCALRNELKERQLAFQIAASRAMYSSMDIYKYHRYCELHKEAKKIPHLCIVVDEFAELKQQQQEFMNHLTQIARIGRSLGIHLLLATQKPFGVVDDQIWSNSRFHICLKVQDRNDSLDMLKHDDAAYLKEAGAFYFQVGNDEVFIKGKSAWTQAPYKEKDFYEKAKEQQIKLLDHRFTTIEEHSIKDQQPVSSTQLEAICAYIAMKSKKLKLHTAPFIKDSLPSPLSISHHHPSFMEWIMIDDMEQCKQYPKHLLWKDIHHVLIIGIQGSGKEELVKTILHESIRVYERDVHIYIINYANMDTSVYQDVDQVQDIVHPNETERCIRLLEMLKNRNQASQDTILVLHGFMKYHETFHDKDEDLLSLFREGEQTNLHICFTCTDMNDIPYRMQTYFDMQFLLQLRDRADYATILQNPIELYPNAIKGSGIMHYQDTNLVFQTIVYTKEEESQLLIASTHMISKRKIPELPNRIKPKIIQGAIFLGLEIKTLKEVIWKPEKSTILCIFMENRKAKSLAHCFVNNVQTTFSCYKVKEQNNLTYLNNPIKEEIPCILLWEDPLELQNKYDQIQIRSWINAPSFQHILLIKEKELLLWEELLDIPIHCYETDILWIGYGLLDHSYQLKLATQRTEDLKKNQAFLYVKQKATYFQMIEEDEHG